VTPPRPMPLPRTLPDAPISEWEPGYLIALRYRLAQHLRWREACCSEPDDLDTDCLPCTETEDP
jgi:hypothetical protein